VKSIQEAAKEGRINDSAPVKAEAELTIHATTVAVWKLLTDINRWPVWVESISAATLNGALAPSEDFRWKSKGLWINSTLQLVEPVHRLAWTGRSMGIKAIHIWELHRESDDTTLVKTQESMEGLFVRLLINSQALEKTLQSWLSDLKKAAEGG